MTDPGALDHRGTGLSGYDNGVCLLNGVLNGRGRNQGMIAPLRTHLTSSDEVTSCLTMSLKDSTNSSYPN